MERDFARIFTSWGPATDMTKTAVAAVRRGYGVIPVTPHAKRPLCTLTARELKAAGERHPCGVHHAITDPKKARTVFARLGKTGQLNIGIVAHPSRIVVVDVDTPQAVESFLSRWAQAEEDERYLQHSPTVRTPGSADRRHHDGGHYYFALPDGVELPDTPGQLLLEGGGDVRWGWTMTVAPPSVRPEGRYETLGEMREIPGWLLHAIRGRIEQRVHATSRLAERYVNDTVVRWSIETPWAELLERHGWTDTNKLSPCDCPEWEKPGGGTSSEKSATAHTGECDVMPNLEGHGALHLWTTDPPTQLLEWCLAHNTQTVTKLQFVAAMEHDGDELEAKLALGLEPDYGQMVDQIVRSAVRPPDSGPSARESVAEWPNEDEQPADQDEPAVEPSAKGSGDRTLADKLADRLSSVTGFTTEHSKQAIGKELERREIGKILDELNPHDGSTWVPIPHLVDTLSTIHELVDEDIGVLVRDDGETLFPRGKLHVLFGQSEAGKSWLCLEILRQVCQRGGRAAYMDLEDNEKSFGRRLVLDMRVTEAIQWAREGRLLYSRPEEYPTMATAEMLAAQNLDVLVVDAMSEITALVHDGIAAAGVVTRRVMRVFRAVAEAGAAVIVIAHASEKVTHPETAMGPSELKQALTGQEVLLFNEQPLGRGLNGASAIYITKDRTGASAEGVSVARSGSRAYRRLWGRVSMTHVTGRTLELEEYTRTALAVMSAEQPPDQDSGPTRLQLAMVAVLDWLDEHAGAGPIARILDDLADEQQVAERTARRAIEKLLDSNDVHVAGEATSLTGSKPSPVIKLGSKPVPEEES